MTAFEVRTYCDARGLAEIKASTTQAWMSANWGRTKRMPNLNTVLDKIDQAAKPRPKRIEDWTEDDIEEANERVMRAAQAMAAFGSAGGAGQ